MWKTRNIRIGDYYKTVVGLKVLVYLALLHSVNATGYFQLFNKANNKTTTTRYNIVILISLLRESRYACCRFSYFNQE